MKAIRILFAVMGCFVWMLKTTPAFARNSSDGSSDSPVHAQQPASVGGGEQRKNKDEQPGKGPVSEGHRAKGRSSPTQTPTPLQAPNHLEHPMFGNARDHHPPGPASLRQNDARHLSPNPAIVGGAGNTKARNTGAIDGAHVSRRP